MGFRDYFGYGKTVGIRSPYAPPSTLATFAVGEIFGSDIAPLLPLGRADALAIPAVSKARNLLVSTIAQYPLLAFDAAGVRLSTQPTFLYRTDGPVTPYHRLAATIDDLIFYGMSLWAVSRGAKQEGSKRGPILEAAWVPQSDWRIEDGSIVIGDEQRSEDDYILFEVPLFPGLLNVGARTLRGARDTELAWVSRMEAPAYLTELRVTDDTQFEQEEVDVWLAAWIEKHKPGKPSVGLTPFGMELTTHQGSLGESDLFLESRNAIRTDVGSFLNIRAAMLDGTTGTDSLTYTTREGEKSAFFELDLPMWTQPLEQALTAALPGGQRVRFDTTETEGAAPAPITPTQEPTE